MMVKINGIYEPGHSEREWDDERKSREAIIDPRPRPCVYFIRCLDCVKVGYSTNLGARFTRMQMDNPNPLRMYGFVPGGRELEREVHHQLSPYKNSGEWFHWNDAVRETIDAIIEQHGG